MLDVYRQPTFNGIRLHDRIVTQTLVDEEDLSKLTQYKWRLHTNGYIHTNDLDGTVLLHRFVVNCTDPDKHVHHINGDKLDNRKSNLKILDAGSHHRLTNRCKRTLTGKYTKYAGVTYNKATGKWRAFIYFGARQHYIGSFTSDTEAAKAYNHYVVEKQLPHELNIV